MVIAIVISMAILVAIAKGKTIGKATAECKIVNKAEDKIISKVL